jgi:hypothetical protein
MIWNQLQTISSSASIQLLGTPIFYSFAHWVLGLGGDIVVGNQHVHATLMLHPPHTIIDLVGLVHRVVVGGGGDVIIKMKLQ